MRGEQAGRLPGWLRATLGTAGDVVLFAALSLAIWTVLPAVALGATPVVISGGSMSPLIRAGDVVLLDDTPPPEGEMFAPGTVLTFEPTDAAGTPTGGLLTHRVSSVQDGHYLTRGDANAGDDPRPIHPHQVVGAGRWLIPLIGLPAHWARGGDWHLVVLTALGGVAAVLASLAGRRRVVIEEIEIEQVEDERPLERPLEPAVPQPVLAFDLEPTGEDLPAAAEDEPMDPAAAERAAAIAAQAARRGLAGVDRAREEDGEERRTRRGGRTGGSAGSAPVASIVALALALLGSTVAPTFAAAAFVATTSSASNTFTVATAPTDDVAVHVILTGDWGDGFCGDVHVTTTSATPIVWQAEIDFGAAPIHSGAPSQVSEAIWSFDAPTLTLAGEHWNNTVSADTPRTLDFCGTRTSVPVTHVLGPLDDQTALEPAANASPTYSWAFDVAEPITLAGPIGARVEYRASATPPPVHLERWFQIEVLIHDGDGNTTFESQAQIWPPYSTSWTVTQPFDLWTHVPARTLSPGETLEVRLIPFRLDLRVSGETSITLPGWG